MATTYQVNVATRTRDALITARLHAGVPTGTSALLTVRGRIRFRCAWLSKVVTAFWSLLSVWTSGYRISAWRGRQRSDLDLKKWRGSCCTLIRR